MGENTYGKGTVQQHRGIARPFDFYDEPLGSVQYTMAKFYRINGGSTQLRGVQPDLEYPSIIDAEEFGESSQENALPWDQITPAKYQTTHSIRGYDFKTLQQQLDEQIQGNPEFNYILLISNAINKRKKNLGKLGTGGKESGRSGRQSSKPCPC